MDINKYLARIGFRGQAKPDIVTLKQLQPKHMMNIPFENLYIHEEKKIVLEPEFFFKKIVENKRGGFCYEMNGLFYKVLEIIGFEAIRVSARVYDKHEAGPEFDHMAIIVNIGVDQWLADAGFGDSFLEPLILAENLEQKQYGKIYKILRLDEHNYKIASSPDGETFSDMYRFSLIPRELNEFAGMCEFHQTSPESHFTRNKICTLAVPYGRITLSGMKFIETKNGVKTETDVKNSEEYNNILKELFGIA